MVGATLLPAGKTGRVTLWKGGSTQYGHARVSWKAETCLQEALQVSVIYWAGDGLNWREVNNGQPF